MKLNDVILSRIESKEELINKIIDNLTEDPEILENELISSFFSIANSCPTDNTIGALYSLWLTIHDAKRLNLTSDSGTREYLISSMINKLTNDPKTDKDELSLVFFEIANNSPTTQTICAFQTMFFILTDAESINLLK